MRERWYHAGKKSAFYVLVIFGVLDYTKRRDRVKRLEDLEFKDDFMFCKVMTMNPVICKGVLELILNRKIAQVKVTSTIYLPV